MRRSVGGLGALDVLVNNAGLELITPMLEPGDEVEKTFARIIEINVIGTYYVTREALPLMRRGGAHRAHLVDLGEDRRGGLLRLRHLEACQYRLHARAGEGARSEGHPRQCGLPGLGEDARGAPLARRRSPTRRASTRTTMLGQILAAQALPGLMEPDDVASLYLFLASDHAKNITGQAVNVDRGDTMV